MDIKVILQSLKNKISFVQQCTQSKKYIYIRYHIKRKSKQSLNLESALKKQNKIKIKEKICQDWLSFCEKFWNCMSHHPLTSKIVSTNYV